MQVDRCDVLVAGGGVAGVAAALAAARAGADVLLVEKQCVLGGLATSGLITIYLPLCDGNGTQLSFGIAEELLRLSILHGAQAKYPGAWLDPGHAEERTKQRFQVQFNPALFALECEALLLREGVRLLYDTRVCAARVEDGRVTAVEAENDGGRALLRCGACVDATGSALVLQAAGERTRLHGLGNVCAGWYYSASPEGLRLRPVGSADQPGRPQEGTRYPGVTGEDVSRFVCDSHRLTLAACLAEMEAAPGTEPALLTGMPQLRMTRCLEGETVLTSEADGAVLPDSIGMVGDWRFRGPRFEVPLGCLRGRIGNLYAAGRCVSVDDAMWDVMRVIPCCAVTGQAAGAAAALSAKAGVAPETASVQALLLRQGQRLHLS